MIGEAWRYARHKSVNDRGRGSNIQRDIADRDINSVKHREQEDSQVLGVGESRQLERTAHVEEHAPQTAAQCMYTRQQVRKRELISL